MVRAACINAAASPACSGSLARQLCHASMARSKRPAPTSASPRARHASTSSGCIVQASPQQPGGLVVASRRRERYAPAAVGVGSRPPQVKYSGGLQRLDARRDILQRLVERHRQRCDVASPIHLVEQAPVARREQRRIAGGERFAGGELRARRGNRRSAPQARPGESRMATRWNTSASGESDSGPGATSPALKSNRPLRQCSIAANDCDGKLHPHLDRRPPAQARPGRRRLPRR